MHGAGQDGTITAVVGSCQCHRSCRLYLCSTAREGLGSMASSGAAGGPAAAAMQPGGAPPHRAAAAAALSARAGAVRLSTFYLLLLLQPECLLALYLWHQPTGCHD